MIIDIDDKSPAGAWRREWDARSHTDKEYREKIRELRDRNRDYSAEIYRLRGLIAELEEELAIVHKHIYGGEKRD